MMITGIEDVLNREKPDCVVLYGDTNSCLSALPAKRRKIPIFHMEAGNRCFDMRVPEEINRRIVDHISDVNMVLTEYARQYLIAEGFPKQYIFKTGSNLPEVFHRYEKKIEESAVLENLDLDNKGYFVGSIHREENVDLHDNLKKILDSFSAVIEEYKIPIVMSTHPRTAIAIEGMGTILPRGLKIVKPLGFFDYVKLQKNSLCVLSDSGTLTEECSHFGFPGVMIRETHERPEGMEHGVCILSSLDRAKIIEAIEMALDTKDVRKGDYPAHPVYTPVNVAITVAKIIQSYVPNINRYTWHRTYD
jgi:UDP-N-acetylglucosamine 2-epimerase (non-hydrolysing)